MQSCSISLVISGRELGGGFVRSCSEAQKEFKGS